MQPNREQLRSLVNRFESVCSAIDQPGLSDAALDAATQQWIDASREFEAALDAAGLDGVIAGGRIFTAHESLDRTNAPPSIEGGRISIAQCSKLLDLDRPGPEVN